MNATDFFNELKEVLEIEDVVLSEQTNLKSIDDFNFDSLAVMTLVAFIHEKFDKQFNAMQLNNISTVRSLMELIGLDNFS
jgi:acyl carrier protein